MTPYVCSNDSNVTFLERQDYKTNNKTSGYQGLWEQGRDEQAQGFKAVKLLCGML